MKRYEGNSKKLPVSRQTRAESVGLPDETMSKGGAYGW